MKKLKEFVKKIGNKKRCLLSLLLAGLLIFAIVSGLNGSKSAVTEVNAQSAPTTQNLDLNGIRYTFNTSLSELQNKYSLFRKKQNIDLLQIHESETVDLVWDNDIENTNTEFTTLLKEVVQFRRKSNNKIIDLTFSPNEVTGNTATREFDISGEDTEATNGSFAELEDYNLILNLSKWQQLQSYMQGQNIGGCFTVNFCYVNEEYAQDDMTDTRNNSIVDSYALSNPIDYQYNVNYHNGYKLKLIYVTFENEQSNTQNSLYGRVPSKYNYTHTSYTRNDYFTINNVRFVDSNLTNVIRYNMQYGTQDDKDENNNKIQYPLYQGNILLSTTNYDSSFISAILTPFQNVNPTIDLSGGAFLGGKFNDNKPISTLYFKVYTGGLGVGASTVGVVDDINNLNSNNANYSVFDYILGRPRYKNQNQLLYVEEQKTLRSNINTTQYNALSAQVQDILYNVEYVGNIEQEEFNEKTQDDLIDLLKTTGVGAVIGLLIGFLVGNPIGGLVVGAVIGFAVAIIPLIIDGLQAIFGYDFLSGLYDFFNAITEFFVNIIDKIVGFLLSIITNPFVLVLIVLVAILYIFVIRPKIK